MAPAVTQPSAQQIQYTYDRDSLGRATRQVDADGRVTYRYYHLMGTLTKEVVDPDGLARTNQFLADGWGQVTKEIDPLGNETFYIYDAARLTRTVRPDGADQVSYYSEHGLVTKEVVARGSGLD